MAPTNGSPAARTLERRITNAPTASSIAAARAAQQQERDEVFRLTGVKIGHDGRPVKLPALGRSFRASRTA